MRVLILASLVGCTTPYEYVVTDRNDTAPVDPTPEVEPSPEPDGAPLFARCGADADCLAKPGAVCLTNYPGGLCSHRCEGGGECTVAGRAGRCIAHLCLPSCGPGLDCTAFGGGCVQRIEISIATGNYCAPACFSAERTPPGRPGCVTGTACDEHANTCEAMPRTRGAPNGAPCRDSEECLGGSCLLDGYPGGYCRSLGLLPDRSEFLAGKPLPRSSCPEGSVVLPVFGNGVRAGSLTWCVRGCTSTADCRAGYTCRSVDAHSSGYCAPTDCALDASCPTDYVCTATRCAR